VHELFEDAATTAITQFRNFVIEHLVVAHWILADRARDQILAMGSSLEFVCRGLQLRRRSDLDQTTDRLAVALGLVRNLADRLTSHRGAVDANEWL